MKAEIIAIGDELLIGQVVDTNSTWLGEQLNLIGIDVVRTSSIRDRKEDILSMLNEAIQRVDLILITGGLGPTKDDITKQTLCEFFDTTLIMNELVLGRIKTFFDGRGIPLLEGNMNQAMLPKDCRIIDNLTGTASGMWFERDGKHIISMPGVPHEMKGMMQSEVLASLADKFLNSNIVHRTILTTGIGESLLSKKIELWENGLPDKGIRLAYLPSPGQVRLRMTIHGNKQDELKQLLAASESDVLPLISEHVFGFESDTLESVIGALLTKHGSSLGLAESCTGGYISHLVTSVPGSSRYFRGTLVPYLIEIKEKSGLVSHETLESQGAVSEETAKEMVRGIMKMLDTDFAISTTGIAGPDGGTAAIPVGTVWIGIGGPRGVSAHKFQFGKNRNRNIQMAALAGLNLLRKEILKSFAED